MVSTLAQYDVRSWNEHMSAFRRGRDKWKQGEHILLSGPTSAGKTTLMSKLVPLRSHAVVFVTKMKDPTFAAEFKGWTRLEEWPRGGPKPYENRILLWPSPVKMRNASNDDVIKATMRKQYAIMRFAMNSITEEGNRCVVIDEALMFSDNRLLNLGTELGMMHYYGRSAGISMMTLTQRPVYIPKVILSSVTHAYVARTRDRDDLKKLAELGGIDAREVAMNVTAMQDRHDYLYLNPQGDAIPAVVNTRR